MSWYASALDIQHLYPDLYAKSPDRASVYCELVSGLLNQAAKNAGKDLDRMIEIDELNGGSLKNTAKAVTIDVVVRALRQNTDSEPMSQASQTALGYSWQGTYAVPGGGIANAIMDRDLKRLGIYRQRLRAIDLHGNQRRDNPACSPEENWAGCF